MSDFKMSKEDFQRGFDSFCNRMQNVKKEFHSALPEYEKQLGRELSNNETNGLIVRLMRNEFLQKEVNDDK